MVSNCSSESITSVTFALTGHLIDKLKINRAPVSSTSAAWHIARAALSLTTSIQTKAITAMQRYGMSKFANILFTYELQRRLEAAKLTGHFSSVSPRRFKH